MPDIYNILNRYEDNVHSIIKPIILKKKYKDNVHDNHGLIKPVILKGFSYTTNDEIILIEENLRLREENLRLRAEVERVKHLAKAILGG